MERLSGCAIRHVGWARGSAPAAALVVCEDVTELIELQEELRRQANHDPLTGLVNRRRFHEILEEMLSERSEESPGSVLYTDVDHFKLVNDAGGHRAGDDLLVELAGLLRASVQRTDTVARLGGDEFALLLPGCSLADSVRVAERLRGAVGELHFQADGRVFDISLSIGASAIPAGLDDPDEVVGIVDAACYAAKTDGRDRVSVAPGAQFDIPQPRTDRAWAPRLSGAIDNGEFVLYAQPIVGTHDGEPRRGAEILLRLPEDNGEVLTAGAFIPVAERLGLITQIDIWVVDRVIDTLLTPESPFAALDFLTVNLSPHSIESESFVEHLVERLKEPGVNASRLVFEITERGSLSDYSRAGRALETLSALGCRFAIDDFGVGLSTFDHLRRLGAVDFIKIDGSLIKDVKDDQLAHSIVRSITKIAEDLGMASVAECVEDAELLGVLDRAGARFAQGFGLGEPRPVEDYSAD